MKSSISTTATGAQTAAMAKTGTVGLPWGVECELTPLAAQTLTLRGKYTGCGDRVIRLVWRHVSDTDGASAGGNNVLFVPDEWTISLTASGIDLDNRIAGRIDGIALASSVDYLVWAFIDPFDSSKFKGFGITRAVTNTGITMPAGASFGQSPTVTVGTDQGNRYPIGSRVLFRNGVTSGSSWNQGIVTAHAADTITVTLDAALGLGLNTNTDMSSVGSVTAIVMEGHQPRLGGSGITTAYEGYQYVYVGSIQTDASSNLFGFFRRAGDFLPFPGGLLTVVSRPGITATETFQVALGNWIARGSRKIGGLHRVAITVEVGIAEVRNGFDGLGTAQLIQATMNMNTFAYGMPEVWLRERDTSMFHSYTESGNLTATHQFLLGGWYPQTW
jgi:hypothetical protein